MKILLILLVFASNIMALAEENNHLLAKVTFMGTGLHYEYGNRTRLTLGSDAVAHLLGYYFNQQIGVKQFIYKNFYARITGNYINAGGGVDEILYRDCGFGVNFSIGSQLESINKKFYIGVDWLGTLIYYQQDEKAWSPLAYEMPKIYIGYNF